MAKKKSRTRLTDRKRAAILKAAVREFRSRGFDNTSMDGIAAVAEVSKRTVYNHFASKEALFAAIVEQLKSRADVISDFPYDPKASLEEQLTEIGRSTIGLFASEDFQNLARVILSRFLQSPHLARTMVGEPHAGVADWISAAQQDGRLDVDEPMLATRQFIGLLHAFAFWPQIIGKDPPLSKPAQEATVKSAVAMFLSRYAK
jgi:TetR/AcrR family transcriptional regulator of autoinduction and epiphytic fitness